MDIKTEVEEARKAREDAQAKIVELQLKRTEAEQRIQEIDGSLEGEKKTL